MNKILPHLTKFYKRKWQSAFNLTDLKKVEYSWLLYTFFEIEECEYYQNQDSNLSYYEQKHHK